MVKQKIPRHQLPGHSFADVLALTSATKSNLQHWLREGIIAGDYHGTEGKGSHRRFSTFNLIEIELCVAINRFHVPVMVIRGAANMFRSFHIAAVSLHEEATGIPFESSAVRVVTPGSDGSVMPGRVGLLSGRSARESWARGFVTEQAQRAELPALRTQADADRAVEHAKGVASIWAALRASSLIRGVPDPSLRNHFVGLFVGEVFTDVAIDPKDLHHVIEQSAIVVDLASVIWQVGQRSGHIELAAW